MKKKKEVNFLYIGILVLVLFMGIFLGLAMGIKSGQMMLFEGMGVALADSNINVTIDINETTIVEGVRKIAEEVLVPILNCSKDYSGRSC